ncbi:MULTISPECIES: hypothetical protein [unclassified Exiguobacterium]|jgi:hypothetical protein|uniref:hypothetical protein n=1 Tax=unclassified Exiguobacterium TaxID=2644629 RepID=UPI00093CEE8B|nr:MULTISPECIES: hypothetical protein [unclassified Exiguobacterium]MDE0563928.1 hypothetical protein [Exiguobacterium sp. B2(2022)]
MRHDDYEFDDVEVEEGELFNVYDILPPDGTILEMATAEEMVRAAELEAKHHALQRLQDSNFQLTGVSFKELLTEFEQYEQESMEFWTGVYNRLRIPWAWTIRIDVANGPIHVVNDRDIFIDEEDFEEYDVDDLLEEYEED